MTPILQPDINAKMRSILIDWLIDVHLKFKLKEETLYVCISIIDRYLSKVFLFYKIFEKTFIRIHQQDKSFNLLELQLYLLPANMKKYTLQT